MYKKLFLFLIFLNIQVLSAQNIKEILIVSESWEDYTNEDGSGLYFDVARMIYEPLGIKVKTKIYPYSRSSQMVEKKIADAWLGSYIDEEDYAVYPHYYFDRDIITAMFKKEKYPNPIGLTSLENKDACWIRGYGLDEYLGVTVKVHERNDRKAILMSLEEDRFDFFLDDKYDMKDALEKNNFDTAKYNFVELLEVPLFPGFRNDGRGKELQAIWDRRFKILMQDGSFEKLYIKHDAIDDYRYLQSQ